MGKKTGKIFIEKKKRKRRWKPVGPRVVLRLFMFLCLDVDLKNKSNATNKTKTNTENSPRSPETLFRLFFFSFLLLLFFFLILIGVFLAFLSRERCQSLHVLERFTFQRFLSDVYSFFFLDSHRFCFSISLSLSLSLSSAPMKFGKKETHQWSRYSFTLHQFWNGCVSMKFRE